MDKRRETGILSSAQWPNQGTRGRGILHLKISVADQAEMIRGHPETQGTLSWRWSPGGGQHRDTTSGLQMRPGPGDWCSDDRGLSSRGTRREQSCPG